MARYHMHKAENEITDHGEIEAILLRGQFATLALAQGDEPYVVTLNYGYDPEARALYFHSATEGLKLAFLRSNPRVCGTVIEDHGYVQGKCTHAYRSVVFWGELTLLQDSADKVAGLSRMIDHLEEDPVAVSRRLLSNPERLKNVAVLKLTVYEITGKAGQ
jgi:nitroimidazol reductase NimA-like FMN-containing flavoprotein (pyridoxamine 5'-phosphate oxidase superfamily)